MLGEPATGTGTASVLAIVIKIGVTGIELVSGLLLFESWVTPGGSVSDAVLVIVPVAAALIVALIVKTAVAFLRNVTVVEMLPVPFAAPQALVTLPVPAAPIAQVHVLNVTFVGWLSVTGASATSDGP